MIKSPIFLATVSILLSGCGVTSVKYGDVRHEILSTGDRCNPAVTSGSAVAGKPYFLVTSRLPDCRNSQIAMTTQRSLAVRYARFATPSMGRDDSGKKALLVDLAFQPADDWWGSLAREARVNDGRVLLYVHGYRETFAGAARDTAQIARLTEFAGPVIHYSWPSQARLLKYVADETNMYWAQRHFQVLLERLAKLEGVTEIVVVSHSLGARLVIPALEYVDRNSKSADSSNISNIILASPDVDREDFERDIAEEILAARRVNNDRRITIYLSANDKALGISRTLHGYPRLGSPRCFNPFEAAELKRQGFPVRCYATKTKYDVAPSKSGLAIVDTTEVTKGGSGHSDFLQSSAACRDFAAVVGGAREPINGRLATRLSHVFTLAPPAKGEKPDNDAICKRTNFTAKAALP